MPFEVVLPRLGWNMESGQVGQWLKKEGERVEAGEILFTVEGDKATQEVEALDSGTLHIPSNSPPLGKEVPVGTLLAYLLEPGEAIPSAALPAPDVEQTSASSHASADAVVAGQEASPAAGDDTQHEPTISPRARRVANELGVDWTGLTGSGRTGRIVERDVRQAAEQRQRAASPASISPVARRAASELAVDVEDLAARMPGERITRADIEAEAKRVQAEKAKLEAVKVPAPIGAVVPITKVRKTIADRMATSAHTVAPVTLTTEADATELVRLRKQLKEDGSQPVPSYNDLLAKLVAQALLEHPMVNAHFDGDTIVQAATANIGLAVDSDRGLLVPVLRDVQKKSLRQIARESAALIEKVRANRVAADDLHGGTFTVTNLGMYEIDAFTPIINLPECAILGVGRIVPKQIVVDAEAERLAIRHMMFLSLTFDHRLVDGAPAARFLQRVKQYVERPFLWLVGE
ncbi:MAG: 2-oxo acid dehydrogenase subunit E2 [Caldilineaceae bacterium]|nr:2-oxo acid dehydrogenase subunit E2 [Caldilineaceae bacterium]MBP8123058.1 2-oxo acid dehydrogenase subunit E2 [Caldilineaceae bacterium]MBP9073403.1 2-oxo acid dehydrogenase subunit E2 [Caldilineaceae bacterium]